MHLSVLTTLENQRNYFSAVQVVDELTTSQESVFGTNKEQSGMNYFPLLFRDPSRLHFLFS